MFFFEIDNNNSRFDFKGMKLWYAIEIEKLKFVRLAFDIYLKFKSESPSKKSYATHILILEFSW